MSTLEKTLFSLKGVANIPPVSKSAFIFLMGLFLFLFLRPYPVDYIGLMGARLIDLILLIVVFYSILITNVKFDKNTLAFLGLLFLLSFTTIVSTISAPVRLGLPTPGIRDLFESVRYLSLSVYILFGFLIGKSIYYRDVSIYRILKWLLILSITFGVLQLFVPGMVQILSSMYAPEHQTRRIFTTGRITSFFGNPNTNGLMTLILSSGLLSYYFVYKQKFTTSKRKIILVIISLCFLSTLLTGSTTTFLSLIALMFFTYFARMGVRGKDVLYFAILGLFLFAVKDLAIESLRNFNMYLYMRISVLFSIDALQLIRDSEFFGRLPRWKIGWEFFMSAPLIGAGPLRGVAQASTDNFYLYILMRYGLVGFSLLLVFWSLVLFLSRKAIKSSYSSVQFLGYFIFMQTVIVLVANLTLEAQILIPVAYIYFISLGIFLARINVCVLSKSLYQKKIDV